MATPYIGEIRMFAGNFAPSGWAFCNGQIQAISQNSTLFALIGTTYGGDGVSTFALPDLQGRVPLCQGTGPGLTTRVIGEKAGTETVTVTSNQLPSHSHAVNAISTGATQPSPSSGLWAAGPAVYSSAAPSGGAMNAGAIGLSGGNQPHENMTPFLGVSFIISLFGVFPTRN